MSQIKQTSMREIGSEFWQKYEAFYPEKANNEVYLLSGRTAIHYIISDILKKKELHKIMIPSYCCESMILPFIQSGVEVSFFKVDRDAIVYPYDNDADAVLLVDFFGYINQQNSEVAFHEKHRGKIVIYDSTHKIDGNLLVQKNADYSFCSYRKWFYCNYAKATKHTGDFLNNTNLKSHDQYIKLRDESANQKEMYLSGTFLDKQVFLNGFTAAEQLLDEQYVGYKGQPVAFDLENIISKRQENAAYLISEINKMPNIGLWRDKVLANDTPMFVPIFVDHSVRDKLRKALIDESIYCPVHWPKTIFHSDFSPLYDTELSLICDQRYDIYDMKRIVSVIKSFINSQG